MNIKTNVAFIGSAGVPNNYGGFEMFLECCAPKFSEKFNRVFVTCDSARYKNKDKDWHGIVRIFIPISSNGALSVIHDFIAFFAVLCRVDVIIILGVSSGVFFPLFRFICSFLNKKIIVNVDGLEWRRAKFSRTRRCFLYVSDRLAQLFAHKVVVDNDSLRPFLISSIRHEAVLIAYPGDHVERLPTKNNITSRNTQFLTICRIEPENNCHILIEAFKKAAKGNYIFVGNWNASSYGRALREKYQGVIGLEMRDPVYDKNELTHLRETCTVYLHGHSVGGTNPSLVEMLFYDCQILAYDCSFNRSTADSSIGYFCDEEDLATKVKNIRPLASESRVKLRNKYTREKICNAYEKLVHNILTP